MLPQMKIPHLIEIGSSCCIGKWHLTKKPQYNPMFVLSLWFLSCKRPFSKLTISQPIVIDSLVLLDFLIHVDAPAHQWHIPIDDVGRLGSFYGVG